MAFVRELYLFSRDIGKNAEQGMLDKVRKGNGKVRQGSLSAHQHWGYPPVELVRVSRTLPYPTPRWFIASLVLQDLKEHRAFDVVFCANFCKALSKRGEVKGC